MLNSGVTQVHFEPTARCNAKCPMCARTDNQLILNNQAEISYDQFVQYFPEDFVRGLTLFKFCGNYGDPAIAKDLLKFHKYLHDVNPSIQFMMSTNGGIRSEKFWNELGEIYANSHPDSHVQFHIDGLEDTNHLYRIGVKWNKVIDNVKAFNKTGAKSDWYFIPFFHNEHQFEDAEKLSKELGCRKFVILMSARFKEERKPFIYNGGKLYPPTSDRFRFEKHQVDGKLICASEKRKEIYVDAWSRLWPCCWTATSALLDPKINSLKEKSIDQILNDPDMNSWIRNEFANDKSVCHQKCTGKFQHVIDIQGLQATQKDYW